MVLCDLCRVLLSLKAQDRGNVAENCCLLVSLDTAADHFEVTYVEEEIRSVHGRGREMGRHIFAVP